MVYLPVSRLSIFSILTRSNAGLGPRPILDTTDRSGPDESFRGVAALAGNGTKDPVGNGAPLGDNASAGAVDICKGGSALLLPMTSSRLTGIPRAIRCCCLIRDRVQLIGLEGSRELTTTLKRSRLNCGQHCDCCLNLGLSPFWCDQDL